MAALARNLHPQPQGADTFEADILAGLSATPKCVPAKYFYDGAGSQLFERITELPEYYLTRSEMRILHDNAADIAKLIAPGAALVEFGSGSSKKARILLRAAPPLAAYVPVDICGEMIEQEAAELRPDFPQLKVLPVTAGEAPLTLRPYSHWAMVLLVRVMSDVLRCTQPSPEAWEPPYRAVT